MASLRWWKLGAAALVLALLTNPADAQPRRPKAYELRNGHWVAAGEVIVKLRPSTRATARAEIERDEDIEVTETVGDGHLVRMRSRSRSTATLLGNLSRRADVQYAEPNYLVHLLGVPNDPHFDSLWAMRNTGQVVNNHVGLPGADIRAPLAWDVSTGAAANVVAVIDTGIDYTHPDLSANIWTAPSPFTVTIGGVTVTCPAGSHGFNVITAACDPMDDNDHGTHVAGTVGAVGNDAYGIAGVNWVASVMGIKFLDAGGNGTTVDAINAIEFAIQARQVLGTGANVRVLSNSWVLTGPSQALLDQITRADLNEMLFVLAAGNFGTSNDTTPYYPQSYVAPSIISVAATMANDGLWGFSNVGPTTVHLGAPGVDIVSTTRHGGYAFKNGTSMAAPHVSGAAALMLAVESHLSVAELKAGILNTVHPLPVLAGLTVTGGRLDLNAAVRSVVAGPNFRLDLSSAASQAVAAGGSVAYTVTVTGAGGFVDAVTLGVTGLPAGAIAAFTPDVVAGSGASTLQVFTSGATSVGSSLLTIAGRSGALAHTMTVTLDVHAGAPDSTPPAAGSVTPSPGYARFVGSPFDLRTTFSDAGSVVTACEYTTSGGATWSPATVTGSGPSIECVAAGLTGRDGQVLRLNMRATSSGGTAQATAVTVRVDSVAPTGTVRINGTAGSTTSQDVTVLLALTDMSGVAEVCLSNTPACVAWQPFARSVRWTLAGSEGPAMVRVWARDRVGNTSATPLSDQIVLDTTPPTNPASLVSTSHVPGVWSRDATVDVRWTGAADAASGVNAYAVSWTTAPASLPHARADTAAPHSTSGSLRDGGHFVHVRARDGAGHWAPDAVHLGPFLIDRTRPVNGRVSATPGAGEVALAWSGFSDATSGLATSATYRVMEVTAGTPASACASGVEIYRGTATTFVHSGLPAGARYQYRVCAVDEAGNISIGATARATAR